MTRFFRSQIISSVSVCSNYACMHMLISLQFIVFYWFMEEMVNLTPISSWTESLVILKTGWLGECLLALLALFSLCILTHQLYKVALKQKLLQLQYLSIGIMKFSPYKVFFKNYSYHLKSNTHFWNTIIKAYTAGGQITCNW